MIGCLSPPKSGDSAASAVRERQSRRSTFAPSNVARQSVRRGSTTTRHCLIGPDCGTIVIDRSRDSARSVGRARSENFRRPSTRSTVSDSGRVRSRTAAYGVAPVPLAVGCSVILSAVTDNLNVNKSFAVSAANGRLRSNASGIPAVPYRQQKALARRMALLR